MDGITILNKFDISTYTASSDRHLIIIFFISISVIVVCGIIGFCTSGKKIDGAVAGGLTGLFLGLSISFPIGEIFKAPSYKKTVTRYEVIIEDNVSMNEFLKYYTIIERRGEIYVIEKKIINNKI